MQPHSKNSDTQKTVNSQVNALRFQESMLQATNLAMVITASGGTILFVNPAAEKLLGYPAAELLGKTAPVVFYHPNVMLGTAKTGDMPDQKITPAFDVLVPSSPPHQKNEWVFIKKDGSRFPATLSVIAIHDEHQNISAYAGIITDLTEKQELRDLIAISEKKFQLLAENIPGTIYLCENDERYTVIYVNEHIKTLTGYEAEKFLSGEVNFSDLFHPDDRDTIYNTINKSVAEKKNFNLRYRLRHSSGNWRWIAEHGVGVYEGDRLTMLEGFLQDITLQHEAEEKLKKIAEENLRFFNNPVNLNAVADFQGNLRRISPSWTKMLGWSEDELRSRPVLEFVHPEDIEKTKKELRFLSKTTRVHTFENRFSCKDGTYRWLLWGSASDPETGMIYASAVDISARKQSETHILASKSNLEGITLQLQERNRKLDEFAHIISHNLRAPVNNIQALINLLNEESEIHDYKLIFAKLKNVSKNLRETMDELMDMLKAKAQPDVDQTDIRFKEVLDKVVQSLEGELITAHASVTFDFNEAPNIHYSKPYLESIFQNLLTNAIKYKSPDRKPLIHFRTYSAGDHVELQVTDNGMGIDMARHGNEVFGLHKTFHNHNEARGVGLFLVKTQIEALGGTISVASTVDKGTTFTIRFSG